MGELLVESHLTDEGAVVATIPSDLSASRVSGDISTRRPISRREANVGGGERAASVFLGASLAGAGALCGARRHPLLGLALATAGGVLAWRGASGSSAAYRFLGVRPDDAAPLSQPLSREVEVQRSILVDKPREELYAYWRNLRNLPRFMRHLESIEVIDEHRSRWTARGPADGQVSWEAEIAEEREGELIAWQTTEGAAVSHRGRVEFHPAAGNRGCLVSVVMRYQPLGGAVGAAMAALFQREPSQEIGDDLRRFKAIMEAGEAPSTRGQPRGRCRTK